MLAAAPERRINEDWPLDVLWHRQLLITFDGIQATSTVCGFVLLCLRLGFLQNLQRGLLPCKLGMLSSF